MVNMIRTLSTLLVIMILYTKDKLPVIHTSIIQTFITNVTFSFTCSDGVQDDYIRFKAFYTTSCKSEAVSEFLMPIFHR